jgi:ATP-binding cassette subfamily B protein
VNSVVGYFRLSFTGHLGQTLMHNLRIRVFSHIQRLSMNFFTEEKAGKIMTRMTSDIEALQQLFSDGLINLAVQGITLTFVVAVLFSMNARLALIVLLFIVPVMLALTLWFRSASDKAFLRVRERIADVLADLQETLSGIRILAMYNRQRHNTIRHRNIVGEHMDANLTAARISGVYGPGAESVGTIGQAMILAFGGRMVLRGELSVGELTAFVLYLNSFFAPIQQLVALHTTYQQGKAAIVKLAGLFALRPAVPERSDAHALPALEGEIRLNGVTFGYSPEQVVLHDVDITIAAGETFALVGPTGAGKSTIAKLVTRFYDPLAGRVLVDGHDLRDVTFESLRRQLGVVPQEPFLFAGTIGENISFASPDATEEQILEACRAAGIGDLIDRLPDGLDTPCHERGVTLSSGERQLLALARAFLAHPRVLILDEATSSLDLATESKIERALDILLEGRTAILIAHRLNTAMRADRIAVIDDGRVVEMGSHDELIARGGKYADMYGIWVSQGGAREALADT